jgi:hypothetical protein
MTINDIIQYLRSPETPALRYFPHSVAAELSDLAAVLLYDLWGRVVRQKKPLVRDGRQWTYDPMRVFAENHPYASESGIRKAFLALEEADLLRIEKTGRFNKKRYDKKWWFDVIGEGRARAQQRRIRFEPNVAAALDIPKAVLLETFRFHYHHGDADQPVPLIPSELPIPYHPRTIERHLEKLVELGILRPTEDGEHHYALPPEPENNWRMCKEPLTVNRDKLLPELPSGGIGLLVGHSGTGKTSYASFIAVQHALAGLKVLYLSLEEPGGNIVDRMYAQEFGVSYSDLHRGTGSAQSELQAAFAKGASRKTILAKNLKIEDLSGRHSQLHEVCDAIASWQTKGFEPDLVVIDQLEFIGVEAEELSDDSECGSDTTTAAQSAVLGKALPAATLLRDAMGERPFVTWVLHQVMGDCQIDFTENDVSGSSEVTAPFDRVLAIGRARRSACSLCGNNANSIMPLKPTLHTCAFCQKPTLDKSNDAALMRNGQK